jgi:MOSC domain-containing protein YiiM
VSARGRIVQLSVSPGGVPKRGIASVRAGTLGLEGDAHRNTRHHGGPERALCLFAMEAIRALQREGHEVAPGVLGENVTVEGLDWGAVQPGRRLRLGTEVVVEITRFTSPCSNISAAFRDGDSSRVSEKRHPGWSRVYARVLAEGSLTTGDAVLLLEDASTASP